MTIYCSYVVETDNGNKKALIVSKQDIFYYCEDDQTIQIRQNVIRRENISYLALVIGNQVKVLIEQEVE